MRPYVFFHPDRRREIIKIDKDNIFAVISGL